MYHLGTALPTLLPPSIPSYAAGTSASSAAVAILRDYLIALNKVFKELAHCLSVSKLRPDTGSVLGSLGLGRRIQASKKWFRGSVGSGSGASGGSGNDKEEKSGWRRSRPTSIIMSSDDRIITSSTFSTAMEPASPGIPEENSTLSRAQVASDVPGLAKSGELLILTPLPFGLDMGVTTQSLCTVLFEAYETIVRLVEAADRATVFSSAATPARGGRATPKVKTKGSIPQDLYDLAVGLDQFVQRDVVNSVLSIIERQRQRERSEPGTPEVPYAVLPPPGMKSGQTKRHSFVNGGGGGNGGAKEGEQGRLERLLGQLLHEQGAS